MCLTAINGILCNTMDYMISFDKAGAPVMVGGDDFRREVEAMSERPFKSVPIFVPAVWGGHWIQRVLGVGKDQPNIGWAITGIMEAQSLQLESNGDVLSFPVQDLIFMNPTEYLGNKIFYFWGYTSVRCM